MKRDSLKKGITENNLAMSAKGGVIAFLLKISNTALGLLNQIVLARILGAGGIGEVILAVTVVRLAVQVAKFGMEETMMKFVPLYVDQKDESRLKGTILFALKFCILISIAFMALTLISSKFIALNIFHSSVLLKILPIAALGIPAWVTRDVIGGILKGYKDTFRALIPEAVISPFFKIIVFLLLSLKGVSSLFAVIAFAAGEFLALAVSIKLLTLRIGRLRNVEGQCENKKVLDVAYTIIFTSMSVLLYTQADVWILGMFTSTDIVGIYGTTSKLVLLVYFPMMALAAIIPSLISTIHASGDFAELKKVVGESTRWILSTAMPIILILLLEGKYILKYFYGPAFIEGYAVLIILTLGQMIKAGAGLIGVLLQMTGEHKIYMKVNILWGVLNIILNVILVPRYGMIGAASSTAFCLSMVDIICIYIIHKRMKILTLARGLTFDVMFIAIVTACYVLLNYANIYSGQHVLLLISLIVYLWKSLYNNDIPWRLLIARYKEA